MIMKTIVFTYIDKNLVHDIDLSGNNNLAY